ncbi:MAG: InlB B-repeat-containing protein, partial [Romboutsia sp.]|nr:InlB B-repeat-containing protein [Romboutsia sp.]
MKGKRHTKIILLVAALVFFYVLLQGSLAIYREIIGDSVDLSITDTSGNYTVTFNANGGSVDSNEASRSLAPGSEVGELPIATRANYNFDGWYTDPNPNSGTKITDHTLVTGTVTYYAHWNAIVCKIASSLHEEVGTKTITYGNLVSSDTFESGDAFDCDVNNDGTFSASDERFYYLTDDSNGNAVMIYSNNTSGGVPICGDPAVSYNQEGGTDSTINNLGPISSMELLPSTTQWPNVSVHNQPRQITNHLGTTTTTAGTIVPFTYTNKAARYATTQEVEAACEITIPASGNSTNIDITKCEYFLENTSYNISSCRTNYWLETPASTSQNTVFRLARNSSKTGGTVTASNGKSGVRPAIEVPYDAIQPYSDIVTKYRVDFDSQGGSIVVHRDKYANQPIGELPTPTKDGFVFDGWYTTPLTGGTKISSSTVVTAPVTYYARWVDASSAFPYVYRMPGECTFTSSAITNGTNDSCISTINPTGQNIDYTDSTLSAKRYIDTGIALYDTTNHDSDYEIGFDIVSYSPTGQSTDATLMNTKAEDANANYPGVVFRRRSSSTDFLLQSRTTASTNTEYTTNYSGVTSVKIYRIGNKIYYSINGGTKTELNTLAEYNPVFDLTTWFGAAPADATATTAQRYFKGTLSNLYIKLGTYPRESVTVTFHGNNGTLSFNTKTVLEDNQLGELPTATRSGYTFMGWYKESTFDTPVTESTNVTTDLTDVYARWAENVTVTF